MKKFLLASMLMSMQLVCRECPVPMHTVTSLVQSGLCHSLSAGEKVVEVLGLGCTKIGGAGEYILDQARKHHVASGITGLTLLALFLTKTKPGKSVYGSVKYFFTSLLGLRKHYRC